MPISDQKLTLEGNAELLSKLTDDFYQLAISKAKTVPTQRIYRIASASESTFVNRSARKAALRALVKKPLTKVAIDSRRIDQEAIRNPRRNLQYWRRSGQFVDDDMQDKLNVFAKLMDVLNGVKKDYGTEPEYHDSYVRELYGHVERALRLKTGDKDYFGPQLAYLEQLLFARYRLSMEQLRKQSASEIKQAILSKDEDLLKRGVYLNNTGGLNKNSDKSSSIVVDGKTTPQNIVEAIFGNNNLRRDGDRKVERTITITITDEVKE